MLPDPSAKVLILPIISLLTHGPSLETFEMASCTDYELPLMLGQPLNAQLIIARLATLDALSEFEKNECYDVQMAETG